jgi:hypothetical protein
VIFLIDAKTDCEQSRYVSVENASVLLKKLQGALVETIAKTGQNIEAVLWG